MSPPIVELCALGTFPRESYFHDKLANDIHALLDKVVVSVTLEEAQVLYRLLGPDDFFGLAWTVIHLIETAPALPDSIMSETDSNMWAALLVQRLRNAG